MDIVSRLKYYMEKQQIASSQFADTCKIPRPTVSQILNGRNKKISDELIGKIHAAYPSLSILWLMFGEGDMTVRSNIEISEPQNKPSLSFLGSQISDNEQFSNGSDLFLPYTENMSDISSDNSSTGFDPKRADKSMLENENTENDRSETANKRISSIVVFYEDNTFQTFNPAGLSD